MVIETESPAQERSPQLLCEISEPEPQKETSQLKQLDPLKEYGQIMQKKKNPRGTIAFLNIIGQIEGHYVLPPTSKTTKYEHVIPYLLNTAGNSDIDGLLVTINTVGGDVEAGLAIAEMISGLNKPTVSLVLGGGHSIGVPLAVSAQYSFIAKSAAMTVHPVRMSGTVIGAQQTYDYFNKMQDRILDFIVDRSDISRSRVKEIMLATENLALDVGTILIGEEAVNEKLINSVGTLNDAIEKLYSMIQEQKSAKDDASRPSDDM